MRKYKAEQKVVYKYTPSPGYRKNPRINHPENQVLTVGEITELLGDILYYQILEYPGIGFAEQSLYPVTEQTVTLEIKKIKLEPQKVLEKTEELLTAN